VKERRLRTYLHAAGALIGGVGSFGGGISSIGVGNLMKNKPFTAWKTIEPSAVVFGCAVSGLL
tara:strand:- start:543 stop:731 length:189 start_codon:yes stop_codon:yes gene_type:complete